MEQTNQSTFEIDWDFYWDIPPLTFGYDKFERLTQIRESGAACVTTAGTGPLCLKSFTYSSANGTAANGQSDRSKGKLTVASRYNYIGAPFNATVEVKETYQYSGRGGRLSQKETNNVFNGAQKEQFRQTFTWSVAGELASHTYPDCSTPTLCGSAPRSQSYGYTRGRLTSVTGYANSITYHPSGLINDCPRERRDRPPDRRCDRHGAARRDLRGAHQRQPRIVDDGSLQVRWLRETSGRPAPGSICMIL